MACMEHNCLTCGKSWFNNEHGPVVCPNCDSSNMKHYYDEEGYDPDVAFPLDEECGGEGEGEL